MKVITKQFHSPTLKVSAGVPITTTWNNARMIRNHSIRACAKEVLNVNRGIDVVKINLIGSPSTGKTTLAKTLAHLIHEEADTPYIVKIFTRAELLDMETTLSKLLPLNHIMIFDDVSWLVAGNNKAKIDQVQKTFTEIRHLPGGQDIKVIIIFNFHYSMAIPKHLRQANFFGYTDMGSSETDNIQKMVGLKNMHKIEEFRRATFEAGSTHKDKTETTPEIPATFSYKLGKMGKFTYPYRNPFAPALWWNNDSLRHIVFPNREWIKPVCPVCSVTGRTDAERGDVENFKELLISTGYPIAYIRTALRLILLQKGIDTFPPVVKRVTKWIEREMGTKVYDPEELMRVFDLEERNVNNVRPSIEEMEKCKESATPV